MKNIDANRLLELGIALSAERQYDRLFGSIIKEAIELTGADAGSLYQVEDNLLHFNYMITLSKGVDNSADRGEIKIPPVPLGRGHVCACCALDKKLIKIDDIYENSEYDFSGAQKYDSLNDYRTKSMLVVPMLDDNDDCIGVLQLINAMDGDTIIPFSENDERIIRSLASFAGVSLNNRLLSKEISELLHSFVKVMVNAIDTRSHYNAKHTRNMVNYGERFLDWLDDTGSKELIIRQKDRDPFIMSIWLHDIGKLLIPLEIMDKPTRLGDRLDTIKNRITIAKLMERLQGTTDRIKELDEVWDFILRINDSGFLPDEDYQRVLELSNMSCKNEDNESIPLLTEEEIKALSIRRGTLTDEERKSIENHVVYTHQMLSDMRFSGRFKKVPEYAASHHELMDGSGYPNKPLKEDISPLTRLLTILDIYDALTAEDRPYKPPLPTEKAFSILEDMASQGKLDPEILRLFKESKAWERKAL